MIAKFYRFICFLSVCFLATNLSSQDITCNNHINVGVNLSCEIDLTLDVFIEGDDDLGDDPNSPAYFYIIYDPSGAILVMGDVNGPSVVNGIILDHVLDFSVFFGGFQLCSGTLILEDKVAPVIECDCPIGGEDFDNDGIKDGYAEECSLNCWELPIVKSKYWKPLTNRMVPNDVQDFLEDNVSDNCGGIGLHDISYYDVYIDLGCTQGTLLRRTWTVNYPKGGGQYETASCTREYYFEPRGLERVDTARLVNDIPVPIMDSLLLPIEVVQVSCGIDISPASIAAQFDNPISRDQDSDDNNYDPHQGDVDLIVENHEGIPYAYPHYYVEGRNPYGPHPQAIDNEVCNILVAYSDLEVETCKPGCNGNRKVRRTWTLLDWCHGDYIQYDQIIKAIDTDGPDIDVRDVTVSVDPWDCVTNVKLPSPEHLLDNCDLNFVYWIGYVEGGLEVTGNPVEGYTMHDAHEGEIYQVEYVAEDCCGNKGSKFYNVHVVDLTPPVAVTKEFIVVSLTNIGNPEDIQQGVAKVYATDIDNGSHDGCSDVTVDVKRLEPHCESVAASDTSFGEFVKFCCEDLNGKEFVEIDVYLRVRDENGNANYAWSTVRLEDKSNNLQTCPKDIVLTCDMDYNDFSVTGLPKGFAACGQLDLDCDLAAIIDDTQPRRKGPNDGFFDDPRYDGVEVPAYDPSCGFGALRRSFKNCSSCVQWIVVDPTDAFNPLSITFPKDIMVDCDGFDTGEPDFEISVCNLIGVSVEADTFHFESGSCMKILNRWTIINWCTYDPSNPTAGGKYDHLQVVILNDTEDPVLSIPDSTVMAVDGNCFSKGVVLKGSAADQGECSSEWLKWEVTIDLNANWDPDYQYASNLPKYINGDLNPFYVSPTTNDEELTIQLPEGIPSSKTWHRAVWRVYDGCGNNVSTVKYFQITDEKAPTPYCLNLSTAVMSQNGQVELWAIDFDAGSFDNCSSDDILLYTFTDVPPPPRDDTEYDSNSDLQWYNGTFWYYDPVDGSYKDQDDYFDQEADRWDPNVRSAGRIFTMEDVTIGDMAHVPIYVWDECGNRDFCIVNLRLIDNMGVGEGRVSGQMTTENGDYIENVETRLMTDDPAYPISHMTNEFGEYAFDNTPFFRDYSVSAYKDGDYLNGVSTLDLVFIQKHILGQLIFESPYQMIAADVNNDKMITAMDLIDLRKLILGVHNEFPNTNSWKFINKSQDLTIDNAWDYLESIQISDLQDNMLNEDFMGIKVGDVNGSVDLFGNDQDEEQLKPVSLSFTDREVKKGELVSINLKSGVNDLFGCQFTLALNGLSLADMHSLYANEDNIAVFKDAMTMSLNTEESISVNEGIATLHYVADHDGLLSDMISLNSDITKAEAYVGQNLDIVGLQLDKDVEGLFALRQNNPNPFTQSTSIEFSLDQDGPYQMSFYDITGKTLHVISEQGNKGKNIIEIDVRQLDGSGMIYYRLESNNKTDTKHMILID